MADRIAAKVQKHNPKTSKKSDVDPAPTVPVVYENEKLKEGLPDEGEMYAGEVPKLRSTPSATSLQAPVESQQGYSHLSIGGIHTAQRSIASIARSTEAQQPPAAYSIASLEPGTDRLFIPKKPIGLLHSDEFRHPATFNYSRIMWYLVLVDDVFRALDKLVIADGVSVPGKCPMHGVCLTGFQRKKRPFSQITTPPPAKRTTFPPGVFWTMFIAAIFALLLQVGMTSAAVVIVVFTPTIGLGCRSLGYIAYGGVAITIMFLTIISTILARVSETRKDKSPSVEKVTACIAITLRWICYLLAFINSVGLVVLSCFQFSNLLANCYCNASAIGNGTDTYILVVVQDWIPTMRSFRAIGIATATGTISIFMISLGFISTPPPVIKNI